MQGIEFPWSDNWWIENDKAWFCAGEMAALFCVDMNSFQCELIARIPECEFNVFRLYSYCMKYGDKILCLPNIGTRVWCYDLTDSQWEKIEIGNKNQLFMCRSFDKIRNKIYSWCEEGTVFEVNLANRRLEKTYTISKRSSGEIGEYVITENKLYCVCGRHVYCVDLETEEITPYLITEAQADLYTICFDGSNFWLSGFCREIYIWNPDSGVVKVIDREKFPKQFGIYNFSGNQLSLIDYESFATTEYPLFCTSISLGKYVWFIPFQTNGILYINKETCKISILHIEEEVESEESLKQHHLDSKFLIEYIRENRYIGLYSLKNQCIFEIDTIHLCTKNRNYHLSHETILTIISTLINYNNHKVLKERKEMERIFISTLLRERTESISCKSQNINIGEFIYRNSDR